MFGNIMGKALTSKKRMCSPDPVHFLLELKVSAVETISSESTSALIIAESFW